MPKIRVVRQLVDTRNDLVFVRNSLLFPTPFSPEFVMIIKTCDNKKTDKIHSEHRNMCIFEKLITFWLTFQRF